MIFPKRHESFNLLQALTILQPDEHKHVGGLWNLWCLATDRTKNDVSIRNPLFLSCMCETFFLFNRTRRVGVFMYGTPLRSSRTNNYRMYV